jgi:hypothetical protein
MLFGLVIGFIKNQQVVNTINYYTIVRLLNLQSLHANIPRLSAVVFTYSSHGSRTSLTGLCTSNSPCTITHVSPHCWLLSYHSLSLHPHRQTSCILPGSTSLASATYDWLLAPMVSRITPLHGPHGKRSLYSWCFFTERLHSKGHCADRIENATLHCCLACIRSRGV